MSFNDTYRESIQNKHLGNVGFSSTAKGVTNEAYATKNPHDLNASQIPVIDVVATYGPLVASGIAAGKVEEHIVKLTADPTVNSDKAWIAYESNCQTAGHAARGNIRIDSWLRVAETEYKLRVFADDGSGTAPNYSAEVLPSETQFNWGYDHTAGILYFDSNPTSFFSGPLWAKLYTYVGEVLSDKVDVTVSGGGKTFLNLTDGINTATAGNSQDTFTFIGANGASVVVDSAAKSVTISGSPVVTKNSADLVYNIGVWEYAGNFDAIPSDLEVYYNGVKNRDESDYYTSAVISGVLQIDFSFDTYGNEDWVNITWGGSYNSPGLLKEWVEKTSTYQAVKGDRIILNTDGHPAYGVVLPPLPSKGDSVSFFDGGGNCGTVNVTLDRNGQNIMGLAQDMALDSDNVALELIFYNSTKGWRIVD